jgi:hypothetical protein
MATPEEIRTRELENLRNRSEQASLPIPVFQFEALPAELVKAFPKMDVWLRQQNLRLIEHTKKLNVIRAV